MRAEQELDEGEAAAPIARARLALGRTALAPEAGAVLKADRAEKPSSVAEVLTRLSHDVGARRRVPPAEDEERCRSLEVPSCRARPLSICARPGQSGGGQSRARLRCATHSRPAASVGSPPPALGGLLLAVASGSEVVRHVASLRSRSLSQRSKTPASRRIRARAFTCGSPRSRSRSTLDLPPS